MDVEKFQDIYVFLVDFPVDLNDWGESMLVVAMAPHLQSIDFLWLLVLVRLVVSGYLLKMCKSRKYEQINDFKMKIISIATKSGKKCINLAHMTFFIDGKSFADDLYGWKVETHHKTIRLHFRMFVSERQKIANKLHEIE